MKRLALIATMVAQVAAAEPEVILYNLGDPGCEYSTTTNHFWLQPGESVDVEIDLSQCIDRIPGRLFFFSYITTNNYSRRLLQRDKVDLEIVYPSGTMNAQKYEQELADVVEPLVAVVRATNEHPGKDVKLRLRTELLR